MKRTRENSKILYLIGGIAAIAFTAIAYVFTFFDENKVLLGNYYDALTVLLTLVLAVWCVYIVYRMQSSPVRRITSAIIFVCCFWIIIRYLNWMLGFMPALSRNFWYMYVGPMLAISLLFFVLFCEIYLSDFKKRFVLYAVLICVACILFAFAMTNDLHMLVIRFPNGLKNNKDFYDYGPMFYAVLAFCLMLFLATIGLFIYGTARRNKGRQMFSPLVVLAGLIAYFCIFMYYNKEVRTMPVVNDITLVCVIFSAFFLEVCMQCGLIQNSGRYGEYFKKCMVPLCIMDDNGRITYQSSGFNAEELNEKSDDVIFVENVLRGGKVIIREDFQNINRMRKQIEGQNEKLKRNNKILAKSNRFKKEGAALKARRTLFGEIENAVKLKKNGINELIARLPDDITDENREEVKKQLSLLKLKIGYLKQKSMLILFAKTKEYLPENEFRMIADVIKSDVKSVGLFSAAFAVYSAERVSVSFALAFNDFVEYVAENFAFSDAALLITVNTEKRFCVANVECRFKIELSDINKVFSDSTYYLNVSGEDEEYRITMREKEGKDK